jgi:hypothetical protein
MFKATVAFASFIAGAASVLFFHMLSGSQPSVLAQGSKGVVMEGAEPIVPPLHNNVFSAAHLSGVTQPLDGFECEGCDFNDVTFTYAGGAARIANPKFSGTIRVEFKGAAANALVMNAFLQAAVQNQKPPTPSPNTPMMKKANLTTVFVADLVTPYGQK